MTQLKQQVLDRIEELGPEGAAEFFGKTVNQIKTMRRTGNVTLDAYEKLVSKETQSPTVTNATYGSEVSNASEDIAQEQEVLNEKANDLHSRMLAMEDAQTEILNLLRQNNGQRGGNNLVRPQGEVYGQKTLEQIRKQRPGIGSGIAPTREEANKSHSGPSGRLAHAAAPRVLQRGEPGMWDWNDKKAERKAKEEARLKRIANQPQT